MIISFSDSIVNLKSIADMNISGFYRIHDSISFTDKQWRKEEGLSKG